MFWHFPLLWQCVAFASITFISNSKLSSIFGLKHIWWQIFKLVKYIFYMSYLSIHFTHFSMCVWRMLTLVRESCDACWYSESSSFLHSWAWRHDESCLSSGIAIWSFQCSFLYTLNAGMSNTIMILLYNHNKGLHITKLPFIPCHFHPLFCQVYILECNIYILVF